MKEREKCKKNEPSPTSVRQMVLEIFRFKNQEFGQDGHRHFVGFQPRFHLNMMSQTQYSRQWKNESAISQESSG